MAHVGLPSIAPLDHTSYMRLAISLAEKSIPKSTNFRVGAVLVNETTNQILSTGYTLELPGNTHAEQCCLDKYAQSMEVADTEIGDVLPEKAVLYTTMEPCDRRVSGNVPCTDRILITTTGAAGGIKTVYLGVTEPKTFIGDNTGRTKLEDGGIKCVLIPGLESLILQVATAGHKRDRY
jgi:pyrimidine deaminase RibD-like protein